MSLLSDLRAVSENAIDQVASRFSDLPRPLLAAIGAGDMAVERLAALREQVQHGLADVTPDAGDLKDVTSDLPARAQKIAGEVAGSIEKVAAEAPNKVKELVSELPSKVSELGEQLSPDNLKETLEAYTQFVGMVYGNLAERGEQTWSEIRSSKPGTVVDAEPVRERPAAPAAAKPSAPAKTADKPAAKPAPAAAAKPAPAAKPVHKVAHPATKLAAKPASKPAVKPVPAAKAAASKSAATKRTEA